MSEAIPMTKERYQYLMSRGVVFLTDEEVAQGWHFCDDWDGLLINCDSKEMESCGCDLKGS